MRSGTCPKCGSTDIYVGEAIKGEYGAGAIPVGGIWRRTYAPQDYYVCVECGYVECYVSQREHINKIIRVWLRVDKRKRENDEYG